MSFGVKAASILVGIILVPMTINYVNPIQYGVWLTISSIVAWMNFFDIGLGNGLKNKLAHSIAVDQHAEARNYISTTYALLFIISSIIFLCFLFINVFLDWHSILNIPANSVEDLEAIVLIVVGSFCVQFVLQTLNTILIATHQPAKTAVISFLGQVFVFACIIILRKWMPSNLKALVIVATGIPIIVTLIATVYFFRNSLKAFTPSFYSIHLKYIRPLLNLGIMFFVIQMGALILFQTDNIVITRILGPEAVTIFNVSYKLFSVVTMIFVIIITPYWSAFTDAYASQDFQWMKNSMDLIRKVCIFLSLAAFLVYLLSPWIFNLWLGDTIRIDRTLTFAMMIYAIAYIWQTAHVFLLNGVGKIRLQLILVILSAIINIPLAVILGHRWGLPGIISASSILFIVMGSVFYLQTEKIVNQNAKGIWDK
ncbi:MAG: oligosaccharide flippase family protein [Chitinophagaceae bacterium]|nr:oligosaccharide flippase family protein [Chitinophagaceae bacterium]